MDFRVLGPIQVHHRGMPAVLRPKAAILLGLLLLHAHRPLSSEFLVDRLWSGQPPTSFAAAMRVHLTAIRAAVREPGRATSRLARARDGYILTVEPGELDADRFDESVTSAVRHQERDPATALALLRAGLDEWHGVPFTGLDDIDGALAARTALEQRRAAAIVALCNAALSISADEQLLRDGPAWVHEHPTNERIAAAYVTAVYRGGDSVEALRRHREFVGRMREDYGLDPSESFVRLEGRILDHDPRLVGAPIGGGESQITAARPLHRLIGRDSLMASIEHTIDSAGAGCVVALNGEAGIGKSQILAALVLSRPRAVLVTAEGEDRPLAAIDLLAERLGDPTAGPERRSTSPSEIAGRMSELLADRRIELIAVDNVDRLDDDSRLVLQRIAEASPQHRWVTTARSPSVAHNPLLRDQRILAASTSVTIPPLEQADAAQVARRWARDASAEMVDSIVRRSGGNPLLLEALGRSVARGETDVPWSALQYVAGLLDSLEAGDRRFVELASIDIGSEIDVPTIALATDRSVDEAVASAERCVAIGLLTEAENGLVFRHSLMIEGVRRSLSSARLRELHRTVATTLLSAHAAVEPADLDPSRLAHHLRVVASGDPSVRAAAAHWTAREATAERNRGAMAAAAAHFLTAVGLAQDASLPTGVTERWRLWAAEALALSGQLARGHELALDVGAIALRDADHALLADAAVIATGPVIPTGPERARAVALLTEAWRWLDGLDEVRRVRVAEAASRATMAARSVYDQALLAHVQPVLEDACSPDRPPGIAVLGLMGLRMSTWAHRLGPLDRLRLSDAAYRHARGLDDGRRLKLMLQRVIDHFESASPALDRVLTALVAAADHTHSAFYCWTAHRLAASIAQVRADRPEMRRALDEAARHAAGVDPELRSAADLELLVADVASRGRLGSLAGDEPTVFDAETQPTVALALLAIAASRGMNVDPIAIQRHYTAAGSGSLRPAASAFATIGLRGAGQFPRHLVDELIDDLAPLTNGVCLVDGGLACMGPADHYLATLFTMRGDVASAQIHSDRAATVAADFARSWADRTGD